MDDDWFPIDDEEEPESANVAQTLIEDEFYTLWSKALGSMCLSAHCSHWISSGNAAVSTQFKALLRTTTDYLIARQNAICASVKSVDKHCVTDKKKSRHHVIVSSGWCSYQAGRVLGTGGLSRGDSAHCTQRTPRWTNAVGIVQTAALQVLTEN